MKTLAISLVLLGLATPAFAQDKAPVTPPAQTVADGAVAPPLTEVEQLKLDRVIMLQEVSKLLDELAKTRQLYIDAISKVSGFEKNTQDQYNSQYWATVLKGLEDARPGFKFDPKAGKFVLAPKVESAATKKP